ncbi:MAG: hypothetical protein ACKV0T_05385 [Planctomycetales bacterium]
MKHQERNRFTRAFEALDQLARAAHAPLAIVGGLAAIRYGYPAVTDDIDLVAPTAALDSLLQAAPQFGFRIKWRSASGWHTLSFEDVEINIVPEGGKAKDSSPTSIPGPVALGVSVGLDYAVLPGWIELKLSSGRTKDKTHVVEVLKQLDAPAIAEIEMHIAHVHETYAQLLRQLLDAAQEEKRQEADRGKSAGS